MRSIQAVVLSLVFALLRAETVDQSTVRVSERIVEPSFGHNGNLWGQSQDSQGIPGWQLSGDQGYRPDVLSDRIILTPPYPGNRRGAIWADQAVKHDQWTAELQFRVSGQERGGGNLQIWYTKDGPATVGTSSIYTVGKFDGLALVLSQYEGRGGSLRGFLNDGQTSYRDHHQVDRLAFGNCDFSYRNLGRFARITLRQDADALEVRVDNQACFRAPKVKLPSGYNFGITAASAENPDSFEVKAFITRIPSEDKQEATRGVSRGETSRQQSARQGADTTPNDGSWYWITDEKKDISNAPASSFQTDAQRFEDLHNRLSVVSTALDFLYDDLTTLKTQTEKRHEELLRRLDELQTSLAPAKEQFEWNRRVMDEMKGQLKSIREDVQTKDYRENLKQLHQSMREGQQKLMAGMPDATAMMQSTRPRLVPFALISIVSQFVLLAGYEMYRRRRDQQPKKYL